MAFYIAGNDQEKCDGCVCLLGNQTACNQSVAAIIARANQYRYTRLRVFFEDLLHAAIGEFDHELVTLDVCDGAVTELWMSDVISNRIFRGGDTWSGGGCCCIL